MNWRDMPYLHYLAPEYVGGNHGELVLQSPMETEDAAQGGSLYAPVQANGRFFPTYRFDYSLYFGKGQFARTSEGKKAILTDLAVTTVIERRQCVLLVFRQLWHAWPEHWFDKQQLMDFPVFPQFASEPLIPTLRRSRRPALRYRGRLEHEDFSHPFAELEQTDKQVFHELLTVLHVALIGCNPHSRYRA